MPCGYARSRGGAERAAEARVRAVGDDDVAGAHLLDRAVSLRLTTAPRTSPRSTTGAVASASCHTVAPAFTALLGDDLVEVVAASRRSRTREVGVLGPLELERDAVGDGRAARRSGGSRPSASARPMSSSWRTARGVRPSPQVFSRGNVFFSTSEDVVAGLGQPVGGRPRRPARRPRRARRGGRCAGHQCPPVAVAGCGSLGGAARARILVGSHRALVATTSLTS